jgi:UDP-glucose 4-epimerase
MMRHGINKFIFSSTAATFGNPHYSPIDENHPQKPINPYGRTKLIIEQVLIDYARAYNMRSVCLRYFNAAGADPEGQLGERHEPETHLIPLVLKTAAGKNKEIVIYGNDYDTPDGTCVRDYIHVMDLCSAHWLALKSLLGGAESQFYNLGNNHGFSVKEVIETAKRITGRTIAAVNSQRRLGDPARLVANSNLIREKLGWQPRFTTLEVILAHAWAWEINSI